MPPRSLKEELQAQMNKFKPGDRVVCRWGSRKWESARFLKAYICRKKKTIPFVVFLVQTGRKKYLPIGDFLKSKNAKSVPWRQIRFPSRGPYAN